MSLGPEQQTAAGEALVEEEATASQEGATVSQEGATVSQEEASASQEEASASQEEATRRSDEEGPAIPRRLLYGVFFLSGMAALIYQLAWQRALFTIYGSNSASITAIVTAFMLGLGLGSLAGGVISKQTRRSLVVLFAALEGSIGLFGLLSLPLARWLGEMTAGISALSAGLVTFVIFLIPTGLMGATLPVLVTYLVGQELSVGETVGNLYGANTIGSAAVCFLTTALFFDVLGLQGSVWVAAAINGVVALSVLFYFRSWRGASQEDV